MAVIIGGSKASPNAGERLTGTGGEDLIFGDRHTGGAGDYDFPGVPGVGGRLTSGAGGNDRLEGRGDNDALFGDAFEIAGTGKGGADVLYGGGKILRGGPGSPFEELYGDAYVMSGNARGGSDTIHVGPGGGFAEFHPGVVAAGDAFRMQDEARGGNDTVIGGSGGDKIVGDAVSLNGGACGDDRLYGDDGDDILAGDVEFVERTSSSTAKIVSAGPSPVK